MSIGSLRQPIRVLTVTVLFLLLLSACGKHVPGSVRSYSVLVSCNVEPSPHCLLSENITGFLENLTNPIKMAVITLISENAMIRDGAYKGRLAISGHQGTPHNHEVVVVIKHGRASLQHPKLLWQWVQKQMARSTAETIYWTVTNLPVKIAHPSVKHGAIEAILIYSGQKVASSTTHLVPAKGCWFHELQCQSH